MSHTLSYNLNYLQMNMLNITSSPKNLIDESNDCFKMPLVSNLDEEFQKWFNSKILNCKEENSDVIDENIPSEPLFEDDILEFKFESKDINFKNQNEIQKEFNIPRLVKANEFEDANDSTTKIVNNKIVESKCDCDQEIHNESSKSIPNVAIYNDASAEVNSEIKVPKNGTKSNTKKDLSSRYDVINKTLIRAIKRYYSYEMGITSNNLFKINSSKMIECCERIDKLCKEIFSENFLPEVIEKSIPLHDILLSKGKNINLCINNINRNSRETNISYRKFGKNPLKITAIIYDSYKDDIEAAKKNVQLYHEIKILLACMTIRLSIKGILQQLSIRSIFTTYYDSVYNYSHKKLKILMRFGCFRMVLEKFATSGPLDKMLTEDPTLNKNPLMYKEAASILLNLHNEQDYSA